MGKKIIYWLFDLFDSENKYLNSLCISQIKMIGEEKHVKEFFELLKENKDE